jgi:hypothetical protein
MAKESARGWRKWVPSVTTIVKVFVALVVIKVVTNAIGTAVPAQVWPYWPKLQ